MEHLRRARTWLIARLAERRVELRLCLRITVAAVLTFCVSQVLHLPWALWAVLTSVIVTQMSVGKSLIATVDYMIGTLGGGIYSGIIGLLLPHSTNLEIALSLAVAVGPLSLLASSNSRFAAAPFTAVMVFLLPTITHASPLDSAFYRVIEVAVGCATSLCVSFLVLPQSANSLIYEATARILVRMADLLPILAEDLRGARSGMTVHKLQDHIGNAFRQLAAINIEAMRERSAYLNSGPDPQPLIDVTLRLRHDIVLLGRAAVEPLPDFVLARLQGPITQVCDAGRGFLVSCAAALTARVGPAPLEELETALANFSAAFAALRRDGVLRDMPTDSAERIFALGFCFEQIRGDFKASQTNVCKLARVASPDAAKKPDAKIEEIA
jgi:uncharacterized membrane protein YccC